MTVVAVLDRNVCPDCGQALDVLTWAEPALFVHGGYGATRRTTVALCACGWWLQRERSEERPVRRRTA